MADFTMQNSSRLRRWATVLVTAFLVIAGSHLVRGRGLEFALLEGALWAVATTAVFAAWDSYRLRRGQHCAVCDGGDAARRRD
jgi:dolichyl-phosphate-mannose--protein O-mannosyl transferase